MMVNGQKMRLTRARNRHEQPLWDSKIETLKQSDVTVTAQVLQRAVSQKTKPKYLTSGKVAVQPLKVTPAPQRPRTEQDKDTIHRTGIPN